jgi:hypothetical protein
LWTSLRTPGLVQSTDRPYRTAAVAVFLLLYSSLLIVAPGLLRDADTISHIYTGQWILDHARFPTVDFYSYTAAGKPWIATEWLSEIVLAVAYKFGDWRAVAILGAASCSAIIGILCFYLVRHLRFSVAIGWTALTTAAISPHFLARPHIFSYVLLIIWMINLVNAYDDDNFNLPPLLTLAPLMILWANIHGSFTFGLVLLYVFTGACLYQHFARNDYKKCRRLLVVAAAVTACAMITPYGISPVFMTTKLLDMKFAHTYIVEWRSPDFQGHRFRLIYMAAIFLTIAGFGIRLLWPRLISFGLIIVMGLSYIRGLLMFFLLAPVILARPVGECAEYLGPQLLDERATESDKALDPVLAVLWRRSKTILAVCAAVAVLITVSMWWRQDIVPPKSLVPKEAIDFVQRNNIAGNVFNSYQFGGYLISLGIPTFIDSRAELFGDTFLKKYVDTVNVVDIGSAFELLDDYKVNWVLLDPTEPLARALARSALWDEVYVDDDAVVFVRHREPQS